MSTQFDAIIVGSGQAATALAGRLTAAGQTVAFIERKLIGGTCVNVGCTPTKAMVASAYAAQLTRRAADYGVTVPGKITVDMKAVKARKDKIVTNSRTGSEKSLQAMEKLTLFRGHGSFVSAHEVRVGAELLSAEKIFLNVGTRASVAGIEGTKEVPYFTNSTLLDVDFVPPQLVVVGGSYVGLEFAQMFRRFGSEVTVVERGDRLIKREDPDVSEAVKKILENEQIDFRLGAECIRLQSREGKAVVHVSCASGEPEAVGTHVLLAVGRRPNTDDLGLDKAGIEHDERGYIKVDDQLRTSVPGIWALGDCNGKGAFTHTSYNDFEIVAANLLDNDLRRVSDRIPVSAMYVDPPLAQIGMTETEVRKTGKPALIGTRPMTKVNRAVEKGESQGFMKVLVDAESKKILGATILGVGGDEAIHCLLDVMYAGAPYTRISRAVHIHPTVSELIPTLLQGLKPLE